MVLLAGVLFPFYHAYFLGRWFFVGLYDLFFVMSWNRICVIATENVSEGCVVTWKHPEELRSLLRQSLMVYL